MPKPNQRTRICTSDKDRSKEVELTLVVGQLIISYVGDSILTQIFKRFCSIRDS